MEEEKLAYSLQNRGLTPYEFYTSDVFVPYIFILVTRTERFQRFLFGICPNSLRFGPWPTCKRHEWYFLFHERRTGLQELCYCKPNPPRRKGIGFGSASGAGPEGNRSDENEAMDEAVQEAKLLRQVNALIVAHLRGQSLGQAAAAVAAATMTPLSAADSVPSNHLLRFVAKGLAAERGGAASAFDSAGFGGVVPPLGSGAVDFSVQDVRGSSKSFPKHEARHVSDHKNIARCAKFSPDGKYFATGSADTSIKFFEVAKVKQTMIGDSKDGNARPVIRTFYDHMQVSMSYVHIWVYLPFKAVRLFSTLPQDCFWFRLLQFVVEICSLSFVEHCCDT